MKKLRAGVLKELPAAAEHCGSPAPAWDEADRLAALAGYDILNTPPERAFDDVVRLAAQICKAPIVLASLVAEGRQWFKAEVGLGVSETSRDVWICSHAILQRGLFVVPDTIRDARFACNPLVTGPAQLRFYAGAIVETADGLPLGTLCVLDRVPRPEGLTPDQAFVLEALARQVMSLLELRRALAEKREQEAKLRVSEERLRLALNATEMVGTWVWDIPQDRVAIGPSFVHMLGIDPAMAAAGVPLAALTAAIHPDDRSHVEAAITRALEACGTYEAEYRLVQADGTVCWVVARGCCERDAAGRPSRFPGVVVDITERKRAEEGHDLLARALAPPQEHLRGGGRHSDALGRPHQPDGKAFRGGLSPPAQGPGRGARIHPAA